MIFKSSHILFFILVASTAVCNFQEKLTAITEQRSPLLISLSDNSASVETIRDELNKFYEDYLSISLIHTSSLKDLLEDFFFNKVQLLIKTADTFEKFQNDVKIFIDSQFEDLQTLAVEFKLISEIGNQVENHPSSEVEKAIQNKYFQNIDKITASIKDFVRKEFAIKAAENLADQDSESMNIQIETIDYILQLLVEKCNELVIELKTNIPGHVNQILDDISENYHDNIFLEVKNMLAFVRILKNPFDELHIQTTYNTLTIETEDVNTAESVALVLERTDALYNIIINHISEGINKDIILNHFDRIVNWDNTLTKEKKITPNQRSFNLAIIQKMALVCIDQLGKTDRVFQRIKEFIKFNYRIYKDNGITKLLESIIAKRGGIKFNKDNATTERLLFLDIIVQSYFGKQTGSLNNEIELSADDVKNIAENLSDIMNVDFKNAEIFAESKLMFTLDLFAIENNTDFYTRFYSIISDLFVNQEGKLQTITWALDLDKYIDQLYTQSNDLWVQENYFQLKFFNVFMYNAKTESDIEFLPFGDHTIKSALEFFNNPKNQQLKNYLVTVYKAISEKKFNAKKDGDVYLTFFSNKIVSTKYFNFIRQGEETVETSKGLETHKLDRKRVGIDASIQGNTHILNGYVREGEQPAGQIEPKVENVKNPIIEEPVDNQLLNKKKGKNRRPKRNNLSSEDDEKELNDSLNGETQVNTQPIVGVIEGQQPSDLGLLEDSKNTGNADINELVRKELLKRHELRKQNPTIDINDDEFNEEEKKFLQELEKQEKEVIPGQTSNSIPENTFNLESTPSKSIIGSPRSNIPRKSSIRDIEEQDELLKSKLVDLGLDEDANGLNNISPNGNNDINIAKSQHANVLDIDENLNQDEYTSFSKLGLEDEMFNWGFKKNPELHKVNSQVEEPHFNILNQSFNVNQNEHDKPISELGDDYLPIEENLDNELSQLRRQNVKTYKDEPANGIPQLVDLKKSFSADQDELNKSLPDLDDYDFLIEEDLNLEEHKILRQNAITLDGKSQNVSPHKISDEKRKNIVNVLKGQLSPKEFDRFVNSNILQVIEEMPEFDEEEGVETHYVYVQVVSKNSPCANVIFGQ